MEPNLNLGHVVFTGLSRLYMTMYWNILIYLDLLYLLGHVLLNRTCCIYWDISYLLAHVVWEISSSLAHEKMTWCRTPLPGRPWQPSWPSCGRRGPLAGCRCSPWGTSRTGTIWSNTRPDRSLGYWITWGWHGTISWLTDLGSSFKKSCIRETKHLSTDAYSITATTVGWTKNTQKPNFFEKRTKKSKTSWNMPKLAIRPLTRGL